MNKPSSGYKIECVIDYNPHLYRGCGSTKYASQMEAQTVWQPQGDGRHGLCRATCGTHGRSLKRCLGGHFDEGAAYSYEDQSCETQSPAWKNWYPTSSGGKIVCSIVYYIDYNRFKYVRQEGVKSPQDVWAVDFWFYTGTCHAVYKRVNGFEYYDSESDKKIANNNNFKEITLEWNYHIKIRIYTVKITDNPDAVDYDYYFDCTPIVVIEHPDLDSPEVYSKNLGNRHYKWTYVTCGVNFQEKVFYQTNTNRFSEEMSFTSKLVTIPPDDTIFVLNEKSPSGYGFTHVKQLRLWHCYNCAHAFRNLDYAANDFNFNAVYHNFDGNTDGRAGPQELFYDQARNITRYGYQEYRLTQAADFPGYTIRYNPGGPVLCDETIYNYYSEVNDRCERHFNLARINDFQLKIQSSRNARYSMDFWFFIENSSELSPGFNIYWENHMSVTLLRDTSNKNTINAICFPQSYRDNVDGKGGQEIIDIYDNALNKDKYAFYQGSSIWSFVRCSVDQTRKRFFINDNIELDLEGEVLYGTTRNYRPFRYFKINNEHYLKFQNAKKNPTRIFIRQVKCYKDYMDYRLMDMKHLKCGDDKYPYNYWYDCRFYPISFCFDLGEQINPNWPCTDSRPCFNCNVDYSCGLVYHHFKETGDNVLSREYHRWKELLRTDVDVYYPTFPDIYMPYFCYDGAGGGNKENCGSSKNACRMKNSTDFFWPNEDGYYIELDTLIKTKKCTDACRPPDGYYTRNYCLIEKKTNNMLNCPYEVTKASLHTYNANNYYDQYECPEEYVRVYYECIDKNIVPYSAMYFSNVYSFPNVVFSAPGSNLGNGEYIDWKDEPRLASYYLEIWMKFDMINYRVENTEIEHYLYAHPHQIIKDPID